MAEAGERLWPIVKAAACCGSSLVWKRFKRLNEDIDSDVTLYSFRHTGAIEIFKRTGSLHKLQKAMGHSNLNVSLTYLRGLEVAELKEEDMPMV